MAHSPETINMVVGIALGLVAEQSRGTPEGAIAQEMLDKHLARTRPQTLSHAGVSYPQTAGEA